ncbi:hypothetical protein NMG60_11022512 [Bertholletia excelsa]
MAGVSTFTPFSCKAFSMTPQLSQFGPMASLLHVNSIGCAGGKSAEERTRVRFRERGVCRVQAVDEYDHVPMDAVSEIYLLKKKLVDSYIGTGRWKSATSETHAEVLELISVLEAVNPTPAPTEALALLNGKWILAYTSCTALSGLLSGKLPVVKVEEISQTIDSATLSVQNSVLFSWLLATTSISTNAKFEVRSPRRIQIKFQEGIIGTPQLTDSLVVPENMEFLGQNINLEPFKGMIISMQETASNVVKPISCQPPLTFSISHGGAESWLLTTYLDEELRISRGDGGSVCVLIKEGSSLLPPPTVPKNENFP